ncbi:virion core protein, T7 gp14 family [Achromobacter aegrifaciens]
MLMLAVSVAGAAMQQKASNNAVEAQAETNNRNTAEGYRTAQEESRQNDAQAFEAQTDRARKAQQQLSMARVIAAQGGGSLAARAININAGAAEDYSRIDASLANQRSSTQGKMAALQAQSQDAMAQASAQMSANRTNFLASAGSAAVSAAGMAYSNISTEELAKNRASDYKLPKDR